MSKQITFGMEAKQKLLEGATILNNAVSSTLGPRGQNVAIDYGYAAIVVHDGVTVAKAIDHKDPQINMGIRLVREAANKQVDEVGDGTTVVTILAQAIISECLKITSTGVNAMSLRRGLEEGVEILNAELDRISTPINTREEKIQIATISAEDPELGEMIGDILHKLGAEAVITVEESKSAETYVEHQEGMQFDKGFISPYFVTDLTRNEATIENTFILITDTNIVNAPDLQPLSVLLTDKLKTRNLVIIAPDVTDSALASTVITKVNGGMNLLCIAAPYFGDKQKAFLEDLAVLTGGRVVTSDGGMRLADITEEFLGYADRVTSTKDATLIVGGKGTQEEIDERVANIRAELEREEGSAFEIEKLKERIGKLSTGVAVVKVGGHTEVEMKERKERAIDAVAATKAAIEEGIVAGGETIYIRIMKSLGHEVRASDIILRAALYKPFHKLLENAGMEAAKYEDKLKGNQGVDVTDGTIKDMLKAGIIDPVKVPKSAIRNAVSVAIQVMTTNVVITEEPKEEKTK